MINLSSLSARHHPAVCATMTPVVCLASVKYRHPLVLLRFLSQVTNGPQTPDQWRDRIACQRVGNSVDTQLMNNWAVHYVTAIPLRRIDGTLFRCDGHPASTHTDSSEVIHVLAEDIFSFFWLRGEVQSVRAAAFPGTSSEVGITVFTDNWKRCQTPGALVSSLLSSTNFPFLLNSLQSHLLLFFPSHLLPPCHCFCRFDCKGAIIISSFPPFSLFNATLLLVLLLI